MPKPQRDTADGPPILGFTGGYRFLSNFFIEPDGSHVEGEYQRAKCASAHDRRLFHIGGESDYYSDVRLKAPKLCKGIGRRVEIRPDWEEVKVDVMLFYVRKKFADHPELRRLLDLTGDRYLEETNTWGDTFWGVCRGRGCNTLGHILMQVRGEL